MFSIVGTTKNILDYAHLRFTDVGDFSQSILAQVCEPISFSNTTTWWQLLPAVPLLAVLIFSGVRMLSPGQKLLRLLYALAAIAFTLMIWAYAVPAINGWVGELVRQNWVNRWIPLVDWIGNGYFDENGLMKGHVEVSAFLLLTGIVYLLGYFVLHPKSNTTSLGLIQSYVPPIYYLLLIATFAVWLMTGLTFLLDFWRIPVLLGSRSFPTRLLFHSLRSLFHITLVGSRQEAPEKRSSTKSQRRLKRAKKSVQYLPIAKDFKQRNLFQEIRDTSHRQVRVPQIKVTR